MVLRLSSENDMSRAADGAASSALSSSDTVKMSLKKVSKRLLHSNDSK